MWCAPVSSHAGKRGICPGRGTARRRQGARGQPPCHWQRRGTPRGRDHRPAPESPDATQEPSPVTSDNRTPPTGAAGFRRCVKKTGCMSVPVYRYCGRRPNESFISRQTVRSGARLSLSAAREVYPCSAVSLTAAGLGRTSGRGDVSRAASHEGRLRVRFHEKNPQTFDNPVRPPLDRVFDRAGKFLRESSASCFVFACFRTGVTRLPRTARSTPAADAR